jgi:gluconolactonase
MACSTEYASPPKPPGAGAGPLPGGWRTIAAGTRPCTPMFAAPEDLPTVAFSRVPEPLRKSGPRSAWFEHRPFAQTHSFLEGPAFDRAGNLYCVDMAWGRVFRVSPEGQFSLAVEYAGHPNGLRIHRDGRIFIADRALGLLQMEPGSAQVRPAIGGAAAPSFQGLNDLVFAANGDLYFTDQGDSGLEAPAGSVYCLRADGRMDHILGNLPGPNGLALNADESLLYLNLSRANAVWTVPLGRGSTVRRVSVFIQLSGSTGGPGRHSAGQRRQSRGGAFGSRQRLAVQPGGRTALPRIFRRSRRSPSRPTSWWCTRRSTFPTCRS